MDYTLEENQQSLRKCLKHETLLVSFTKKDGTQRTMRCTLAESAVPAKDQPAKETGTRSVPTTSLAVFDLDKQEWRSFRWDSITGVCNESK
jgi:hypothetical protein